MALPIYPPLAAIHFKNCTFLHSTRSHNIQLIATQCLVYTVMPQYHEINMHIHCVVLTSQLPVVLIIMYSKARPTQYLGMYIVPLTCTWLCRPKARKGSICSAYD